ncbi:MAG TPA: hypothetical protein VEU33_01715, partial [Archangium sp.]|nr:hypothetical protein [Archangium sp.]
MKRRLTKRMKTGALALAGLQILACGAPLEPEAPAAVSQVSQALTPTGVTTVANVTYPAILDQHITNALVDRQRVPDELLRPNVIPDLRVADSSYCNVTVSFHSELALQRNALGYFVYPDGQPPTTRPTTAQLQQNIIFPNTSAQGSNGTLVKG